MVLQKEPQTKHVVVETEELLLRMDIGGSKGILGVDMGHEHNIGQVNGGEGGEEVLVVKVERLDTKLCMGETNYDFEVEGDDEE
jgi:hypothetical protein